MAVLIYAFNFVLCRENIENDLYLRKRMRSIYRERTQFRLHAYISRNFLEQENAGFCIKRKRPGPDEDREALRSMRAEAVASKCWLGHGAENSESLGNRRWHLMLAHLILLTVLVRLDQLPTETVCAGRISKTLTQGRSLLLVRKME
jgi:hypothetical protein